MALPSLPVKKAVIGVFSVIAFVILIVVGGAVSVATLSRKLQEIRSALRGKGEGDPCKSGWRFNLHNHLHNVVLIVNYNFGEHVKETAPLIRRLYSPFFDKIVLLAPTPVPEFRVEAKDTEIKYSSKRFFSYLGIQKAIIENPNAEGYLWMDDDVALNYWHLISGNKSKIWVKRHAGKNFPFNHKVKSNYSDDYADEREHRMKAWEVYRSIDPIFKEQLSKSMMPHKSMYPKRVIGLVYIPRAQGTILANQLIPLFFKHKVWLDMALPMMLFSMAHPKEYDSVLDDMEYRWEHKGDKKDQYNPMDYWSPQISALHPWKLSSLAARLSYVKALAKVDRCVVSFVENPVEDGNVLDD